MLKNVIKEFQQKPLGHLTVVCARPGDGRRTFTIELANDLAMQGISVCYCSITRTKKNLENKLLSCVHMLSTFSQDASYVLKRLSESARVSGAVVILDELSSLVLIERYKHQSSADGKTKIQMELMNKMREIAIQRGIYIVIADTFTHASDTDDMLPLSKEALKLCDRAYILYKDSITEDAFQNTDASRLKLKEIEQ